MLARELAMERMRRADVAMGAASGTEVDNAGTSLTQTTALEATTTGGRRKPTPMSDSFMAARLVPMAAPLTINVEQKVR